MFPRNLCLAALWLLLASVSALASADKDADPKKPKPAKPPRVHSVVLGGAKKVPYSKAGDPAGALPSETELKVRPLVVDGRVKEWTTGEPHDVTDRSFAVRRALGQKAGRPPGAGGAGTAPAIRSLTARARPGASATGASCTGLLQDSTCMSMPWRSMSAGRPSPSSRASSWARATGFRCGRPSPNDSG